ELAQRVRSSASVRKDLQAQIVADREVAFAYVMSAIDAVKQGGVSRIAFAFDNTSVSFGGAAASPNLKAPPSLETGSAWKCSIRDNIENLDKLSAFVAISIGPDGMPQTVEVLDDPG